MSERGVGLAELLIAVALSALILLGLALLFVPAQRGAVQQARRSRAQSDAMFAYRVIAAALAEASRVTEPAVDDGGDALMGCANFQAGVGAIDPSREFAGWEFCVDAGTLYQRRETGVCPLSLSNCGGAGYAALASDVGAIDGAPLFLRRGNAPKTVEVSLRFGPADVRRDLRHDLVTAVAFEGAVE